MNVDEIWVVAPKGFRPSQWVEMLIDFDEAYDLDPHLVDRRLHQGAEILVLHTQLLDPAHPEAIKHNTLLWEMLDKIARMGLIVRAPEGLAQRFPELWDQVMAFCTQRKVKVE
jgi:hypothetical protein